MLSERGWGGIRPGRAGWVDRALWAAHWSSCPRGGLSRAVDVEDQAVLRNGEGLVLSVQRKSAVVHSLQILWTPVAEEETEGQWVSPTSPGSWTPATCLPAHLSGATHMAWALLASRTPSQGFAGRGAENRWGPRGGWANGMPKKTFTRRSVPFTPTCRPCTRPRVVSTSG